MHAREATIGNLVLSPALVIVASWVYSSWSPTKHIFWVFLQTWWTVNYHGWPGEAIVLHHVRVPTEVLLSAVCGQKCLHKKQLWADYWTALHARRAACIYAGILRLICGWHNRCVGWSACIPWDSWFYSANLLPGNWWIAMQIFSQKHCRWSLINCPVFRFSLGATKSLCCLFLTSGCMAIITL